ncbi:hypothetical protein [Roseivirga sp.]|uniref:hypothetical protein n=1 Tax=Roseivirga sp. TaxID=1964215 RepID=UPI002B273F91|nr:hypothetical protein [Roseivirga sp.]
MELNNEPKVDTRFPKVLLGALAVFVIVYLVYKTVIVSTSKVKYTIADVTSIESTSQSRGVGFIYRVKDDSIRDRCFSRLCGRATVGQRLLILYYEDDPKIFEVIEIVQKDIKPPPQGWDEKPDF